MRKYRIRIGLDVDDTLYECNSYAVSILNRRHPDEEPMKVEEIKSWSACGRHGEERIALYSDPEFVRTQPITEGAQEFVKKLAEIADVFFITAVPARCMSARAERLVQDFPEIPPQNIIMGTRKDIISLDIMLDDGSHNISSSRAAYPVLFRKPWNTDLSGLLSVNSYDDFLHFCEMVRNSFSENFPTLGNGGVLCLVGPSGSSKTEIANGLTCLSGFEKPLTSTTRPRRTTEGEDSYRFITEEQFVNEMKLGRYIETTVYSGYHFGTSKQDIDPIVERGNVAVIPIDICGAITLKNLYRERAMLVFTRRNRADAIKSIICRDIDIEDKTRRIMSLDFEYRNSEVCDVEINVGSDVKEAVAEIVKLIRQN